VIRRYFLSAFAAVTIVCGAAVCSSRIAGAASYSWSNGSGGNWSNTANWSSNTNVAPHYPQSGDYADVPGILTGAVNVDIAASAGTLSIDKASTNLDILTGDSLTIGTGLTNNGTINVTAGATSLATLFFNATQTVTGSGDIVLGPYVNTSNLPTLSISSGTLTVAAGQTISGAGAFNNNTLLNQGLINANMPGQTLTLNSNETNAGILEASNGGTLELNSPVSNSGTILASGGTVQFPNTVTGGTLTTTGLSSALLLNGSTFNGVTLSAASTATVAAGAAANVGSGNTNYGTIAVLCSSGANGSLNFNQTQTLSGTGGIVLAPYVNTSHEAALSITGTLTLAAGQTISGAGQINGTLVNQGLINANVPGQSLNENSNSSNAGVMEASNGGTLAVNTVVSNSGTILATGGTVQVTGFGTVNGGTLTAIGPTALQLLNNSTISGVTLSAASTATVAAGVTANVSGGLTNNGTITVLCTSGNSGLLNCNQTQTLSGTGDISLGPYVNPSTLPTLGITGTLTLSASQTVSGAGKISGNYLLNQGLINANAPGQTLSTPSMSGIINSGIMEATNGGILLLSSPVNNSGTILSSGGSVQVSGAIITGGTLTTTSLSQVQLLNSSGLSGVTLSPNSFAVVPVSVTATITGGMTNNGTINLTAGSASTCILQFSGTQTLSGGGGIVLGPYVNAIQLPTLSVQSGTLTVAAGQTISGAGQISGNGIFLNQGLVNANAPGQTLSTPSGNVLNASIMEASNGGILLLNSAVNNAGTILASGGTVQVSNTVTGGTLTTTGPSSSFQLINGGGLSGATLSPSSTAIVPAGAGATITSMTNNGTINITAGSASSATLLFSGTQTLFGSGSIVLGPYVNTTNLPTLSIGGSLTVAPSQTISGAGQLFGSGTSLINQGLVNANVPGETLSTPVSNLTNSGTMEATSGGTLLMNYNVNNVGTIMASGGTVNLIGTVAQVTGSTLTGGTWIARNGSPLFITSAGSMTTNQATVVLDGAGSRFPNINALNNNRGSFSLLGGQSFSTTGSLTNSGTIDVGAISTLTVAGSYSALASSVTIADGLLAFSNTMNEQGLLEGSGTAQGNVNVAAGGTIAPGRINQVGTLSIGGNLALAGSSTLDFDLAGAGSLLSISGSLTANGLTALSFTQSVVPQVGSYTLATFQHTNAVPGNFTLSGAPHGYGLFVLPTSLVLQTPEWAATTGGSWNDGSKWTSGSPPNAVGLTTVVGTGTSTPLTITLDSPQTVGTLVLQNSTSSTGYTLAPGLSGSLTLDNSAAAAFIDVTSGSHAITANVLLNDSLTINTSASSTLRISGNIAQNAPGLSLTLNGSGTLVLSGSDNYTGGTEVIAGELIVTNVKAIADGSNLAVGNGLSVFPAAVVPSFSQSMATVPEPGSLALTAAAAGLLAGCWRRRGRLASRSGMPTFNLAAFHRRAEKSRIPCSWPTLFSFKDDRDFAHLGNPHHVWPGRRRAAAAIRAARQGRRFRRLVLCAGYSGLPIAYSVGQGWAAGGGRVRID
jgi:autotransporter-associated beta strand protein